MLRVDEGEGEVEVRVRLESFERKREIDKRNDRKISTSRAYLSTVLERV